MLTYKFARANVCGYAVVNM